MPSDKVDTTPGSVIHIKGYSSREHQPRNKYLIVLGKESEAIVMAFLISSQLHYLKMDTHKAEVVRIPDKATSFLKAESIIQCFTIERLSLEALADGFENETVTNEGRLSAKYLYKIEETVKASKLLSQTEIDAVIKVLNLKH